MLHDLLSPREIEVLRLISLGHTNQAIARALTPRVTTATAKTYVQRILLKLGVPNRAAAAAVYATRTSPSGANPNQSLDLAEDIPSLSGRRRPTKGRDYDIES